MGCIGLGFRFPARREGCTFSQARTIKTSSSLEWWPAVCFSFKYRDSPYLQLQLFIEEEPE